MKLKLVTVVVTSMLAVSMVNATEIYNKDGNKLDLYGRIAGVRYFYNNSGNDGDRTCVHLGVKCETQISDLLTGYGQWEDTSSNTRDSKISLAFVGLKFNEFGSFDYGTNYGVAYDVGAFTDVLPVHGGNTWTQTGNFMTGCTTNIATYRNNNFFGLIDGLKFAVQYQGKNQGDIIESNGIGWGFSSSYDLGDFSMVATYTKSGRTNRQMRVTSGKNAEVWATGLKYDANGTYIAATYAETHKMTNLNNGHIANRTHNFEAVAQHQFDFGLRPSLAYLQSRGKNILPEGSKDLVKYIEVGTSYFFNKNISTYVDYKINLLEKNSDFSKAFGISTSNIIAVGLTYKF